MRKTLLVTLFTVVGLTGVVGSAVAAPGSATRNGHTLSADNATGLDPAGATVTITGSGYDDPNGYYLALCQVPDDYSYGARPAPCLGGNGQGSEQIGPSSWVTNAFPANGKSVFSISGGSFTAKIRVTEAGPGLDCSQVTCAIISRRDHNASADRFYDVFIPVSFG
ncbi:hypothetical protein GCM10022247_68980 [Allokutzneria multivorans]|uniref:Neocarzinostatin family protein n=1 Tax=Allokutzneria multivorans TaxID=1142134 RepID=A0ABP7U0R0_9PSEU